jgi:hypothetical protein
MSEKKRRLPSVFAEVVTNDLDGYYRWNLQQAQKEKPSVSRVTAARELLDGFCCVLREGKPVPQPILEFLFYGFLKYLDEGVPLERALHLNRPKSRPPGVVTVEPPRAVATVYLYMKRDGYTKTQGLDATCKLLGVSRRNLERFDKEWNLIGNLDEVELEALAQPTAEVKRPAKKSR